MRIMNEEINRKSGLIIIGSGSVTTLLLAFALSALKLLNPGVFSNIAVAAAIVITVVALFSFLFRNVEKTEITRH